MSTSRKSSSYKSKNSDTGPENGGSVDQQKPAKWSEQSYSAEELLNRFTLPQIVKCDKQALLVKKESPLPVNLGQPILLFEKRTIRKILARNVVYDPHTQHFNENDETVVIPADYEGTFLRLRSRTAKDQATHKTIESLLTHQIRAFVNLTKVHAFQVVQEGEHNNFPRTEYTPGNVFLIERLYAGATKVKTDSKFLQFHKSSSSQDVRYLKCKDEKGLDIIVPINHPGEFVEVLPGPQGNGKMSVRSQDLIVAQTFPIVVRYVFSRLRPRLTNFSGLFTLLDAFEETSVVGCVLDRMGFTLIEMPMATPLTFQLALNSAELSSHPVVKHALRLCHNRCHSFATDLKYKYKFVQRILQLSGRKIVGRDDDEDSSPPSATNSARFGVTTTYIYL